MHQLEKAVSYAVSVWKHKAIALALRREKSITVKLDNLLVKEPIPILNGIIHDHLRYKSLHIWDIRWAQKNTQTYDLYLTFGARPKEQTP